MSNEDRYLRLLIQSDKELKTTAVNVTTTATIFSTSLTSGYKRRGFAAYNNSNNDSGECYWGGSDVTVANGMPIPKGAVWALPVASGQATSPYFVADNTANLRIIEMA